MSQQQDETTRVLAAMMDKLPERVVPPVVKNVVPPPSVGPVPPPEVVISPVIPLVIPSMIPPMIPPIIASTSRWQMASSAFLVLQPAYVLMFIRPQGCRGLVKGVRKDIWCHAVFRKGEVPFSDLHTSGRRPHLVEVGTKDLSNEWQEVELGSLSGRGELKVYSWIDSRQEGIWVCSSGSGPDDRARVQGEVCRSCPLCSSSVRNSSEESLKVPKD